MSALITSFVVSYVANNIPALKDWFLKNSALKNHLEECYQRALKAWTVNDSIRKSISDSILSMNDLRNYLSGKPAHIGEDISKLLELWVKELRNDELTYTFIIENKLDFLDSKLDEYFETLRLSIQDELSIIGDKQNQTISRLEDISREIAEIKARQIEDGGARINTFVRKIISETVEPLLHTLRVRSAASVLQAIDSNFKETIQNDNALWANVSFCKGKAYRYTDRKQSIEAFHIAFELCPSNPSYVIEEAKALCEAKKMSDAYKLCQAISSDDIFAIAINTAKSESLLSSAFKIVEDMTDKSVFLQTLAEILASSEGVFIPGLFDEKYIEIPEDLTYDNLPKWTYALSYYRGLLGGLIPLERDGIKDNQNYSKALVVSDQFVHHLNRTDLVGAFPIVRLLNSYWGYIVTGEKGRVDEYQAINKDNLGVPKDIFILMESSLLQMEGRTPEAFALLPGLKENANDLLVNFAILLGFHSNEVGYIVWGLNLAVEKGIVLGENACSSLCISINKNTAFDILPIVADVDFENEKLREIVIELCHFFMGQTIEVDALKKDCLQLPESILPFVAMLLSQGGENDLAFDILQSRVDENIPDFKFRVFINVLMKSREHRPLLYSILKKNRLAGYTEDNQLLMIEYQLAAELTDFDNALAAISIVYEKDADSEDVFLNYLFALSKVHPEQLNSLKQKVLSFHYSSPQSVSFVYSVFAHTGDIPFAAEFLYGKAISMEDDDLKTLFFKESSSGYIRETVCREIDIVSPGVCLFVSVAGQNEALIVKDGTPLGKEVIGKRKGDSFTFQGTEYLIAGIYPPYFKLHADYIKEVTLTGGNNHLRMIRINPEGDIIQELQNAVKEFNPDSVNFEEKKRKATIEYENGRLPLSSLTDESQIIGSYYRLLFGNFKVFVVPVSVFTPLRFLTQEPSSRFVIDLPAIITLFEFSNKTGYKPSVKFLISLYLKDYLITKKEYLKYNPGYDFFEGLNNKSIHRFSDDYQEDINLRMTALCEWVDKYCEAVVDDKSLMLNEHRDSESAMLFVHTMSLIINNDNVLISDEWYYIKNIGGQIKQVSTEFFVSVIESLHESYVDFLLASNIIGATLSDEQIVAELEKSEKGEDNRFQNVLLTVSKNPDLFIPSINAGLILTRSAIISDSLKLSLTNLFSMCFRTRTIEYFRDDEWQRIIQFLNQPYLNCEIVRDCLLAAKQIVFPLSL